MTAVLTIAGYGLREALRRKVFVVVCVLSIAFLVLYWLGARYAFHHIAGVVPPAGVDAQTFAGVVLYANADLPNIVIRDNFVHGMALSNPSSTFTEELSESGSTGLTRTCSSSAFLQPL